MRTVACYSLAPFNTGSLKVPRRAQPTSIQEERRIFFEQLGNAIGAWQLVEMQMFRVYARLLRCENPAVASATFHTVINLNTKLDMTNAAAAITLSGSALLEKWDSLSSRIRKRVKRRNTLAHFVVIYGVNKPVSESGPYLQPSIFDVRPSATAAAQLDHHRIKAIGESFGRLSEDIARFVNLLPVPASSVGKLF
jgi:hypothetical protein